ncbi:MAG TPA: hypothetical protein VIQ76_20395 [Propionibacteriaceae bacterium]
MPAERTSSQTFAIAPTTTGIDAGARRAEDIYLWRAVVLDAIDDVQAGFLAGDEYERAAELHDQERAAAETADERPRLAEVIVDAPPEVLGRAVLAVAALHEPGPEGYCLVCAECRPRRWRWWRKAPEYPCPTRRAMAAELYATPAGPRFTAA